MSTTLKIVLLVLSLIYLFLVARKIKRGQLEISFALFWIFSEIILFILLVFPNLIGLISQFMGFETPSNMLFVITIFIAYYLIFELTVDLSQEYKKNTLLIQEISILKSRMDKIEKKLEK